MKNNYKKETGSYYTPIWLSDFIIKYIEKNSNFNSIKVLEPSCGDGVFIESINKNNIHGKISNISIVDINKNALDIASLLCEKYDFSTVEGDFLEKDFKNSKFNLVIGNPPYIHKKYLSEKQKESCLKYYKYAGADKKRVLNIWPSFIYKSETLLDNDGILAFVIPEELVKVNYAKDTLLFLQNKFDRIEIYTIDKVIFGEAGQNTVVLFAFKKHKNKGTFLGEITIDGTKDNFSLKKHKIKGISYASNSQKMLGSYLNKEEISFIEKINKKFNVIGKISESQTGIVTGANDYFILDSDTANKNKIADNCVPIIRKGYYTNNLLDFSNNDFEKLVKNGKPCYLLKITGTTENKNILNYLKNLEVVGINKRYKCGTYKPNWYNIPNIWESKLVFFKRSHLYPKLILNSSGANVTDSGYRITIPGKEKQFHYCFYNSFTLLMTELLGRSYGGGVLEVTPNEFKQLPIPFFEDIPSENLEQFYSKNLSMIDDILIENDNYLLGDRLGLNKQEIQKIKIIRNKLMNKRLKK